MPELTVLKSLRLARLGPGTISKSTPLTALAVVMFVAFGGLALWKGYLSFAIAIFVVAVAMLPMWWLFSLIYTRLFPEHALLEGAELGNLLIHQAAMGLPQPPENPSLSSNPAHADPLSSREAE